MASTALSSSEQRELVARWREAGAALERQHRRDLATQSPAESRQAAFDMLQLGGMLPADPRRARISGLVEMQRLFTRGHRSGQP